MTLYELLREMSIFYCTLRELGLSSERSKTRTLGYAASFNLGKNNAEHALHIKKYQALLAKELTPSLISQNNSENAPQSFENEFSKILSEDLSFVTCFMNDKDTQPGANQEELEQWNADETELLNSLDTEGQSSTPSRRNPNTNKLFAEKPHQQQDESANVKKFSMTLGSSG